MKAWTDGRMVDEEDAKISLRTHALNYGTAVFEGIRFYETSNGAAVFRLTEHIDRFYRSADGISMSIRHPRNILRDAVKDVIRESGLCSGYIRAIAFYGAGSLSVYPENISVNCAVFPSEISMKQDSLRLRISKFRRMPESSTVPGAKISGFYANSLLAMEDARRQGFDEALMLDEKGMVCEGPAFDFFIVKDGLLMAPLSRSALHGITRSSILEIASSLGIQSIEKDISPEEAIESDEAFFCSTGSGIRWISEIDYMKISKGIGDVTERLKDRFEDIVSLRVPQFKRWLEMV